MFYIASALSGQVDQINAGKANSLPGAKPALKNALSISLSHKGMQILLLAQNHVLSDVSHSGHGLALGAEQGEVDQGGILLDSRSGLPLNVHDDAGVFPVQVSRMFVRQEYGSAGTQAPGDSHP